MDWKKLGTIILLIVSIPLMINIIKFSLHIDSGNPEEITKEGVELIEQATIPFWVGIVDWLDTKGTFGALIIVGLLVALKKMKIL